MPPRGSFDKESFIERILAWILSWGKLAFGTHSFVFPSGLFLSAVLGTGRIPASGDAFLCSSHFIVVWFAFAGCPMCLRRPIHWKTCLGNQGQARCLTGISMKQGRPPARSGAAVRKRHGPVRAFPGNSPSPPGCTSRHRGFPSRKAWRTSRHRPRLGDGGRTESRTGCRGNPMNCG